MAADTASTCANAGTDTAFPLHNLYFNSGCLKALVQTQKLPTMFSGCPSDVRSLACACRCQFSDRDWKPRVEPSAQAPLITYPCAHSNVCTPLWRLCAGDLRVNRVLRSEGGEGSNNKSHKRKNGTRRCRFYFLPSIAYAINPPTPIAEPGSTAAVDTGRGRTPVRQSPAASRRLHVVPSAVAHRGDAGSVPSGTG